MEDRAWQQRDAYDNEGDQCPICKGDGWIELACGCCVEECECQHIDDEGSF